ncbi:MAG TPA: DUF819 family protein [Bacteroidales bacterium]|jgi:uncharacterized membrane protein|nr:DUF819 family protein [Bacteroidales bacterium]
MAANILTIAVIILLPSVVLYYKERLKLISWLSPIVTCYSIGIIAGNIPGIPVSRDLLRNIAEISVCLATPMLLFSCDFMKWLKSSKSTFLSFFIGCIAVVIVACIAFLIFRERITDCWKVAGMTVGLYTGATVNLTAIAIALDVDENTFIVLNSADLLFAGLYFLFLITFGKKVFGFALPPYQSYETGNGEDQVAETTEHAENPSRMKVVVEVMKSFGVSLPIVGVVVALSMLLIGKMGSTFIILGITTLGIVFSFNKTINRFRYNYEAGDYLLLMFALALGTLSSVQGLITGNFPLVIFVAAVVFASALLHVLVASLFRIENDTVIITSAAVLFGPAFILPVAESIKNREVIVAGLSMALLGNAFGTYLGIALAYLLEYWF